MSLSKLEIKIIQYVRKKRCVKYELLVRKFHRVDVNPLIGRYLHADYVSPHDPDGFEVGGIPNDAEVSLTRDGLLEAESRDWFDTRYVCSQILVPILIGVAASMITSFLLP